LNCGKLNTHLFIHLFFCPLALHFYNSIAPDFQKAESNRKAGKVMKGNLLQTSPENTKKQQEDAGMFMKEQSEETQEQQTKDKIERWMAQVRVDRPEEVTIWSTDSPRVFLSAAQVEMQRNHVQMQKNNALVNKLHARTQNLRGVPSAIIPEHAVRALQAAEDARKSAEYSQTQRNVESRRRSWGSTSGEAYVDFIFHASEYELDLYFFHELTRMTRSM